MPEHACGKRINELTHKLDGLRTRRQELAIDQHDQPQPLTDADLRALQEHARHVIEHGDPPARKALLQSLINDVRVVSRGEIYPSFSLPAVRPPSGSVPPAGIEPASRA
jgi:site-specific DNA recombinase